MKFLGNASFGELGSVVSPKSRKRKQADWRQDSRSNRYLRRIRCQSAWAAAHKKDSLGGIGSPCTEPPRRTEGNHRVAHQPITIIVHIISRPCRVSRARGWPPRENAARGAALASGANPKLVRYQDKGLVYRRIGISRISLVRRAGLVE